MNQVKKITFFNYSYQDDDKIIKKRTRNL